MTIEAGSDDKTQNIVHTFTFTLEPNDHVEAMRLHPQPRSFLRWLPPIAFGLPALCSLISLLTGGASEIGVYPLLVPFFLFGGYLLYRFVLIPSQVRRSFTQNQELKLPQTITITDSFIQFSTSMTTSKRPWDSFARWKEGSQSLLLYFTDNTLLVIPKRVLDETTIAFVKAKLKDNNVTTKPPIQMSTIIVVVLILLFVLLQFWASGRFGS